MAKIQIATLRAEREALLIWLQDEEVLHIAETQASAEAAKNDVAYQLAELQFTLEFIQRVRRLTGNLAKKTWRNLFAHKPAASLAQLNATLAQLNSRELTRQAHALHEKLNSLKAYQEKLEQELALYRPWQELPLSGEMLATSGAGDVRHFLLFIPKRYEAAWTGGLADIPTAIYQTVRYAEGENSQPIAMEVVVGHEDERLLLDFMAAYNAEIVSLPLRLNQSIAQKMQALKKEVEKNMEETQNILQQASRLLPQEENIQFAYDAYLHELERDTVTRTLFTTPYTSILTGWIPKAWYPDFVAKLAHDFPEAFVAEIAIEENDKPPVHFINNKFIQPFEAVTNLYGKPGYHELDPSGPLALFFLLAFGLALTDAGYGIVLMMATFLAEKFFRLKRDMKKMTRLLGLAGAMTVILGALTGGWFGIALETLPDSVVRDVLLAIKIIDPLTEPMKLLAAAFVIGITQLLFAWVVKAAHQWRAGQKTPAVLDNAPWLIIIILIGVWVATQNKVLPAAWQAGAGWAVIAAAILVVITQGRSYKNPFLKVGGGVLSLYGLMNFMSDTLSYSRLLALGLATGIIGFVVNLLAGMAFAQVPVVGALLAAAILLVGHVFNLGINTLGAFIHAGRLQFVEFFPKFLEGGGLPFRPLGRVSKYVDNPREFSP